MKRLIAVVVAVVLLVALTGGPAVAAKQTIVHVYPGDSIQAAVDTPGVTKVIVHAGVYNQPVVFGLEDSNITLQGEDGAILDGTGLGNVNAITLAASGVTIRGFEIRDYGGQGIRADGTIGAPLSDITLRHLNIHDVGSQNSHAHTIDIRNAADVIIQNVTIVVDAGDKWWAEGIRLQSIVGVQVINVDVDGGDNGVNFALSTETALGPPTSGVVKSSTFANNIFAGVLIAHSTDATIVGNEITGAGFAGIYVGYTSGGVTGITVKGNDVSGSVGVAKWGGAGGHGIVLNYNVDFILVLGNQVSNNLKDGIALYGSSSNNQVNENEVSGSGMYGISLRGGASNNLVKENEVSGSGTFDLHWDGSGTGNVWEENEYDTSNLP